MGAPTGRNGRRTVGRPAGSGEALPAARSRRPACLLGEYAMLIESPSSNLCASRAGEFEHIGLVEALFHWCPLMSGTTWLSEVGDSYSRTSLTGILPRMALE